MYNIFLVKQEKELIGKKVILRKSKKQNWREWAELRQRSRNFLQPWEPKWPNTFLTKVSVYNDQKELSEFCDSIDIITGLPLIYLYLMMLKILLLNLLEQVGQYLQRSDINIK